MILQSRKSLVKSFPFLRAKRLMSDDGQNKPMIPLEERSTEFLEKQVKILNRLIDYDNKFLRKIQEYQYYLIKSSLSLYRLDGHFLMFLGDLYQFNPEKLKMAKVKHLKVHESIHHQEYMNHLTLNTLETFAKRWAHHRVNLKTIQKILLMRKKESESLPDSSSSG